MPPRSSGCRDTIADRSIPIRLQRKRRSEPVEGFRLRDVKLTTEPLRDEIAAWAAENGEALGEARPDLPEELNDRMQEGCEPLLAIADLLGHGERTRAALVELLAGDRADSRESLQLQLLSDVRDIFTERDCSAIASETLVSALKTHNSTWENYYSRGLNAGDVARLLHDYGVSSRTVRPSEEPTVTRKGYRREDLKDAWARYLPEASDA
jgi:Protein of unknown function (DUF3631)